MIVTYQGISLISRLIAFVTRSKWTHASLLHPRTGQVVEAWSGSVRLTNDITVGHTPGTLVTIWKFKPGVCTEDQDLAAFHYALTKLGKPYDYFGILHFITKRSENPKDQDKWFCSELDFQSYVQQCVYLLMRIEAWKVYPGMITISPLLEEACTIRLGINGAFSIISGEWPVQTSQGVPS